VVLASQRFILVLVPTISYLRQIGTENTVCSGQCLVNYRATPYVWLDVRSQREVTRVSVTTWAGIELILGTKVISVDVRRKTLDTSTGETISYERLIVATGARVCPHPIYACPCYFFFFPTLCAISYRPAGC
jgi:hypothetical protein